MVADSLIWLAHRWPHRRRCTRSGATCCELAAQMRCEGAPLVKIANMAGQERGWRVATVPGAVLLGVALGTGGCAPPANHTPDMPPPTHGIPGNAPGPSPVGGSGQLTN